MSSWCLYLKARPSKDDGRLHGSSLNLFGFWVGDSLVGKLLHFVLSSNIVRTEIISGEDFRVFVVVVGFALVFCVVRQRVAAAFMDRCATTVNR